MTTCRSWCGKDYQDDSVPIAPFDIDKTGVARCSQACLDRATAKPATCGVVIAGVPCKLPEGHVFTNGHGVATTAPERKLAKGWRLVDAESWCCTTKDGSVRGDWHAGAYAKGYLGACEAHAAEMGVFEQLEGQADSETGGQ